MQQNAMDFNVNFNGKMNSTGTRESTPSDVPQDVNFSKILMRLRQSMVTNSTTNETEKSSSFKSVETQRNINDFNTLSTLKRTIPADDSNSRGSNTSHVTTNPASQSSDFDRILQTLRRSMETKTPSTSEQDATQSTDLPRNMEMPIANKATNLENFNETLTYSKERPNNKVLTDGFATSYGAPESHPINKTQEYTSAALKSIETIPPPPPKFKKKSKTPETPKWNNTKIILENHIEIPTVASKSTDATKTLLKHKIPKTEILDDNDVAGNDDEPLSKRQKISIKLPKMKVIPISQSAVASDLDEEMESEKLSNTSPKEKTEIEQKSLPKIRVISLDKLMEKKEVKVEQPKRDRRDNSHKELAPRVVIQNRRPSFEFLRNCRAGDRNNQIKSDKNEKNQQSHIDKKAQDPKSLDRAKSSTNIDKKTPDPKSFERVKSGTNIDKKSRDPKSFDTAKSSTYIDKKTPDPKSLDRSKTSTNESRREKSSSDRNLKSNSDKSSNQRKSSSTSQYTEKEQCTKKASNQRESSSSKSTKSNENKSSGNNTSLPYNPFKSNPMSPKTPTTKQKSTDKSSKTDQPIKSKDKHPSTSSVPSKKESSTTNTFKKNEWLSESRTAKDKRSNEKQSSPSKSRTSEKDVNSKSRSQQRSEHSSSRKIDANSLKQPRVLDNETHKRMVDRFLKANDENDKKSERSNSHGRSSHSRTAHTPTRSSRTSRSPIHHASRKSKSPSNLSWGIYCRRADFKLIHLSKRYETYKKNPEKHPSYEVEWQEFWEKRKSELIAKGEDYRTHDYKADWVPHFDKRLKLLLEDDFEAAKIVLREELSLPMTNKYIKNRKYFVNRFEIKSNSVKESKIPIASATLSPHGMGITEQTPTFVDVLNLLMKHDGDLGRFKEKVVNLLAKALQAEILGPVEEIALINDENCTLLEAIAEKFKGLIILDNSKGKALREAISKVEMFLKVAFKLKQKKEELALEHAAQLIVNGADTTQVPNTTMIPFPTQQPYPMVDYTTNVYDPTLDWQQQQQQMQLFQQQQQPLQPNMAAYDWNQNPNQSWGINQWPENGQSMGPGPGPAPGPGPSPFNQNYFC